ncbi:geranyltranstransferase [Gammaproteobacteria bacterium]|nr:geranyltranstransferase [Gammaproteobacteria bacterium]
MQNNISLTWAQKMQAHFENCFTQCFDENFAKQDTHPNLANAMRYSALNGGKRLRPLLVYASAALFINMHTTNNPNIPDPNAFDSNSDSNLDVNLDSYASALEMIHVYSLIHDDLPAMDNDDLRRGKPTCHIAFGEASAILAGDGLLTLSFNILADANMPDSLKIALISLLSNCAGIAGMVDGQMRDLMSENKDISFATLTTIHAKKTGALIKASILGGALCAHAQPQDLEQLAIFAEHLGLAFQIQDDVLDVTSDSLTLGKTAGKDATQHKATYPSVLGFENAKQAAQDQVTAALEALAKFDERADHLRDIARYVINRKY